MPQLTYNTVIIDPEKLRAFTGDVLTRQGVPPDDAGYVAWHLVETNLRGTDSHGVARLPHYVRRLQAGSIHPKPIMDFQRRAPSLGVLDGGHGLGHIVMRRAADYCISLARETGAGWVAVRNSSHCGALAPFALKLAESDMVAIVFTHVDPMVLPYGAIEPFCGTNPICLAAPGKDGRTLCLDMATSIVPWNVVANAAREGSKIPEGWAVDGDGCGTTDPKRVAALFPFGEHKGSGLGILIDVLCALLSGAPYGPDIPKMYGDLNQHRCLGGLIGAIHISAMTDATTFTQRVAEMAKRLSQLRPAPGVGRVQFPGEPELEVRSQRLREGIPVGVQELDELNALANELNLPRLHAMSRGESHA